MKKVAVYAIALNEAKFAARFMEGVKEADAVYVLDTGSTDETVEILRAHGAIVQQQIFTPWRFDVARNASLAMVPDDADIVFAVDLDEVPDAGWRDAVEETFRTNPGANRLFYLYVWNHTAKGEPATSLFKEKIHTRHGFTWRCPVHEILTPNPDTKEQYATCHTFVHHHWADDTKSRSNYLPLLELGVQEDPSNDRNSHYYGRELHFYHRHNEAITELKRHLQLPSARWEPERANSMRYISRSYAALGNKDDAVRWALRACAEAPGEREPWLQLAFCYNAVDNHEGTWYAVQQLFAIKERPRSYISEPESWGAIPYDLAAVSSYYLGFRQSAEGYARKAVELAPNDARIKENLRCITEGEYGSGGGGEQSASGSFIIGGGSTTLRT